MAGGGLAATGGQLPGALLIAAGLAAVFGLLVAVHTRRGPAGSLRTG